MTDRTWNGGSGDWADPDQWAAGDTGAPGAPIPGDTATVGSGTADLVGAEGLDGSFYDGVGITLGDGASDPAMLQLSGAYLASLASVTLAGSATIASDGTSAIACPVADAVAGSILTLSGDPSVQNGLLVTNDASVTVAAGATLDLEGRITDEAGAAITAAAGATLINDAAVLIEGSTIDVGGALIGTGTITLGDACTVDLEGSVSSGQTIAFSDVDGRLEIAAPNVFAGAITGFGSGDLLDVTSVVASSAAYDAATQTLSLYGAAGQVLTQLHDVQAAAGTLNVADDGQGGTTISYAGSLPRKKYQITDGDRAVRADVARTTELAPTTGAPITGAGVKVGVISSSFDRVAPGSANADAAAGYLPANPDGTSAVTVLTDSGQGDDEGRAMLEEVHQIAPGAQLYFAANGSSQADFAAAVQALQRAGCQIIVDDITYTRGPDYQVDAGAATSEAAAVAAGVDVFTSAGNYGRAYLEQPFTPQATVLSDGRAADAEVFDDGTPYETVTIPGGKSTEVDLEWTAPYEGAGDAGAPDALGLEVFDASGKRVGTGRVATMAGVQTADVYFSFPVENEATDYRLAVTLNGQQVSPSAFKMILSSGGLTGGTGPGGIFHDEASGQGSGDERAQQLVPGVNTVGESYFANSAAFGLTPSYDYADSDVGPGTLLYDSSGDLLPAPQNAGKVDFDAPSGIYTTVPGFQPFDGTSAAAPNAAAVAALMLQANPNLTPAQVTALLGSTAIDQGLPALQQGAGLVQADAAVAAAIAAGQAPGDAASIDPAITVDAAGDAVLTGRASSPSGVASVEISAVAGGTRRNLGAATVNPDGTFSFVDAIGSTAQSFITATVHDAAGGYALVDAPFSLAGGASGDQTVVRQDSYSADGSTLLSRTAFQSSGSRIVSLAAPGQTVALQPFDVAAGHQQPDTAFVFSAGDGLDVVSGFKLGGSGHDTLQLPSADFTTLAAVFRNTGDVGGSAFITDPQTGDAIRLAGVTTAQLRAHARDVVLAG
ncbi:S8 family serine peptidase [Lichenibacterium dinghuense]|uniref:S8 family serine peptidase n=1 Tax=Lichenibacterium dinghuense TaxID=2895977 RepID=UPI001EFFF097|nr:S8 family serine peptidase [Lichenibacterium sp. 6Y81]